MDRIVFTLADTPITLEMLLYGAGIVFALLLLAVLVLSVRQARARAEEAEQRLVDAKAAAARNEQLERHLAYLMQVQNEMTGRVQSLQQTVGNATSEIQRTVNERLDQQGQRVGLAIQETNVKTNEQLSKLAERLAVIDSAQTNITQLSRDMVSLQSILSNKQTRGAFGQGRMEALITDQLPPGSFAFQYTLSNNKRPDCVVFMPNGGPKLVIDAKFPLESWERLRAAESDADAKQAMAGFRTDIGYHVKTISENYLIPDETQDTAFMFVPSESIFADIHERFDDLVQKAMRARVVIVSPLMLMLAIQVMQSLLRDVRMREEAHKIQKEVRELLDDVARLKDRVLKLQSHFQQANDDISTILTSTAKVVRRGQRIDELDLDEPTSASEAPLPLERKVSGSLF